eukprot:TRINITY_DN535_c0_g1_i1.p1 TRINITY_DN535_c0_g1~~TRINITY_DN535_c0_g1_i1.p1  ORF type:complete len:148 (+),score=56.28 TRINITY_DN535_c0_g1_i1:164-607(+)
MARRLTKELAELRKMPLDWCQCGPVDDNIMHWSAMMVGPDNSPYAGGVFKLDIEISPEYPFKAPKVKFLTRIYHPNIRTEGGEICADILNDNWGPTLNLSHVLNTLRQMLLEPSAESPLEPDIARQLAEDKAQFLKTAAKYTADFAS